MAGQDFNINGRNFNDDRSRFLWRQVENLWQLLVIFMMSSRDFFVSPRFSWWQVEVFMMTGRDFHGDRSSFCYESLRFSWYIIAPPKFWSTREKLRHSTFMGNFQTMQSHAFDQPIQRMVYHLSVLGGHEVCCYGLSSF